MTVEFHAFDDGVGALLPSMTTLVPSEFHGQLGNYTLRRDADDLIYNYQSEFGGYRHAYAFGVLLKGNMDCGCILSRRYTYISPHVAVTGKWPNNYRKIDFRAAELCKLIGKQLGEQFECDSKSYVLWRRA